MSQSNRCYPFVRVSDRALVRFLERACGLDATALRTSIEGSLNRASTQAAKIKTADFEIVADGLRYVVKNNVVVNVVAVDGAVRRKTPRTP